MFCKTPGYNNPETHVSTDNRFRTHFVLIFSDLSKAQTYKNSYKYSPYHKIEILISFNYLSLFEPNEHTED